MKTVNMKAKALLSIALLSLSPVVVAMADPVPPTPEQSIAALREEMAQLRKTMQDKQGYDLLVIDSTTSKLRRDIHQDMQHSYDSTSGDVQDLNEALDDVRHDLKRKLAAVSNAPKGLPALLADCQGTGAVKPCEEVMQLMETLRGDSFTEGNPKYLTNKKTEIEARAKSLDAAKLATDLTAANEALVKAQKALTDAKIDAKTEEKDYTAEQKACLLYTSDAADE